MFHSACISLSQEFTDEFNECFVLESWNPSFFYALLKTNLEEGGLVKQVMFSLNQFYLANNDREDLMINETFPGATSPLEYAFGVHECRRNWVFFRPGGDVCGCHVL